MPVNSETGFREAGNYRLRLFEQGMVRIDDLSVTSDLTYRYGDLFRYQLLLPYFGIFRDRDGVVTTLVDANTVLLIPPGQHVHIDHPVPGVGHSAIVASLSRELVEGTKVRSPSAPTRISIPSMRLRLDAQRLLLRVCGSVREHAAHKLIKRSLNEIYSGSRPIARPSRIVEQTKKILHARSLERLSSRTIASEIGVNRIYLSQEFTRTEGIPFYRYQLQLRLSRALVELPHCENITGLALDLGFSSHCHFTSAFRSHFGVTPSNYRSSVQRERIVPALARPKLAEANARQRNCI